MQTTPTTNVVAFVEGELKGVEAGNKVTLKHEPIPNIGMPAMTMSFAVRDAVQLKGLKPGDSVRFKAEKGQDGFVVTDIVRK